MLIIYYHADWNLRSCLALICVGGTESEYEHFVLDQGNDPDFSDFAGLRDISFTADTIYKGLSKTNDFGKENIRYLFHYPHDVDGNNKYDDIDPNIHLSQKDRFRNYLTQWPIAEWAPDPPIFPLFIIYITGFGCQEGIYIDPTLSDPSKQFISALELDLWLQDLEAGLEAAGIYMYEILIIIEANQANGFLDHLWYTGENHQSRRLIITSAEGDAKISSKGDQISFSYSLWKQLPEKSLHDAFETAQWEFDHQNPQLRYDPDAYNDPNDFFLNQIAMSSFAFPKIEEVTLTSLQEYHRFIFRPRFRLDSQFPLEKVRAEIGTPQCPTSWRRRKVKMEQANDDPNCSVPSYNFCLPGRYTLHLYMQDEKGRLSIPYFTYLDMNIPILEDDYEPDNEIAQAKRYKGAEQIHSFHDPDDIDWLEFEALAGVNYYISLAPLCFLPDDPNIVPFEVRIVVNEDVILLNLNKKNEYGSSNPPVYMTTWTSETLQTIRMNMKPAGKSLPFLPYRISIEKQANYGYTNIIKQKWVVRKEIKDFMKHVYLSNNQNEICTPLADEWDPINSDYLYKFSCLFSIKSDSYSLWLSDKILDPHFDIKPLTRYLTGYFDFDSPPHPEPGSDCDCDDIFNEDDPNPDCPNIILHSGLNLYHPATIVPLPSASQPGTGLNIAFHPMTVVKSLPIEVLFYTLPPF